MRILFLVHAHPELQAGGTEIFARDLFRTLVADGASGVFLAGTSLNQRPGSPGTPFQAIGWHADEVLVWTAGFDAFNMSQRDFYGLGKPLAELLCEHRPDIVHIHHLLTLGVEVVAVIRRCLPDCKIVMTLHDYYAICANDGQLVTPSGGLCQGARPDRCHRCFPDRTLTDFKLRELHIGRALDQVHHFIAPSRFLKERYVAWGLPAESISVVANGIPPVEVAPARRTKRRDSFAFFGHINKFKGVTIALDASAILSEQGFQHTVTIHGGTDHQTDQTLQRFAAACSRAPDAHYRGAYRRHEFKRLIESADWVIFPSQWWENSPLVISEAFQQLRPVICSNIGGSIEAVTDGTNGLHFPVGNAQALSETMRHAVEERGLWQHLVDGITPPHAIVDSAREHRALYNELILSRVKAAAA